MTCNLGDPMSLRHPVWESGCICLSVHLSVCLPACVGGSPFLKKVNLWKICHVHIDHYTQILSTQILNTQECTICHVHIDYQTPILYQIKILIYHVHVENSIFFILHMKISMCHVHIFHHTPILEHIGISIYRMRIEYCTQILYVLGISICNVEIDHNLQVFEHIGIYLSSACIGERR